MRGAGERAVVRSAPPPPHCLRPPSIHTHTCQPPINVTGSERFESTADPRPNAPHSGHQLTRYVQALPQSQERNTKSQPDKYTKVVPGRSWPSVWAGAPNHQGHTNSKTLSCYGTH